MCLEDRDEAIDWVTRSGNGYQQTLLFNYLDTFPKPPWVPEWPKQIPDPTRDQVLAGQEMGASIVGNPEDCAESLRKWEGDRRRPADHGAVGQHLSAGPHGAHGRAVRELGDSRVRPRSRSTRRAGTGAKPRRASPLSEPPEGAWRPRSTVRPPEIFGGRRRAPGDHGPPFALRRSLGDAGGRRATAVHRSPSGGLCSQPGTGTIANRSSFHTKLVGPDQRRRRSRRRTRPLPRGPCVSRRLPGSPRPPHLVPAPPSGSLEPAHFVPAPASAPASRVRQYGARPAGPVRGSPARGSGPARRSPRGPDRSTAAGAGRSTAPGAG